MLPGRFGAKGQRLSAARGKPSQAKPALPDSEPLLTSNDLFGDLVDAPLPPRSEGPGREAPIRIQLSDKSQARQVSRAVGPEAAAEIEDLLARLDGATPPEPSAPDARLEASAPDAQLVRAGEQTDPQMTVEALLPRESHVDLGAERESARAAETPLAAPPADTPGPERTVAHPEYGPYRLIERVAFGGMAEVFKAKRSGVEGFEKVVALKRILPHLSDNKEFVDMFVD